MQLTGCGVQTDLMGVCQVAVLSDVHGVLPVLEAVLAEPEVAVADLVVVTGDHASGPEPTAVLDRLLALGESVLLVRGNADRELVALARGEQSTSPTRSLRGPQRNSARTTWRCWPISRTPPRSKSTASVRCCSAMARPETPGGCLGRHPARAVAGGLRRAFP